MPLSHTPTILALAAAAVIGHAILAHHLRAVRHDVRRIEDLGERVVDAEQTILAVLRGGEAAAEDTAARMLG